MSTEDGNVKNTCNFVSSKQARSDEECLERRQTGFDSIRNTRVDSFKSKLMEMSSPSTWNGFGSRMEKLSIGQGDITISEGTNGPVMNLSAQLKEKLHKPWESALILKNMGRPHTPNFMITKLKQKWSLIGHWQLTNLDDGYFVVGSR